MAKRASKAPKTRRRYTAEQRAAAVADVPRVGVVKAALKHKVPESCVSHWAKAAGVTRGGDSKPSRDKEPTTKAMRAERPSKAKVVAGGSDKPAVARDLPLTA
jgi:transposase-like protein